MSQNKIVKNAVIVLICSVLAKLLSYVVEAVLASKLGVGDEADAYAAVISVFNIVFPILDVGIWNVFLPAYKTKLSREGENGADSVANSAIVVFTLISFAVALFLTVMAGPVIRVAAPGFGGEKQAFSARLLRVTAPAYVLLALASILGAMLQSHNRYLGSQLREIGSHLSKIIFILLSFRYLGVFSAVAAVVVGSIFRNLIQLPFINWRWKFKPEIRHNAAELKTMLRGLPAAALTSAISHINGLVDKMIASGAERGSIATLNYGHKLMNLFSGMISTAISASAYPVIIEHISRGEEKQLKRLVYSVFHFLQFFIIPISLYCIAFSSELVELAFERGAFDHQATAATARIFMGYCFLMLPSALTTILSQLFYGYQDTKTVMYVSILNILLNLLLNFTLFPVLGVCGLAYATSISSMICCVVKFYLLRKHVALSALESLKDSGKILLISILCILSVYLVCKVWLRLPVLPMLLLSGSASVLLFAGLSCALRLKTFFDVVNYLKKRIKKRKTRA